MEKGNPQEMLLYWSPDTAEDILKRVHFTCNLSLDSVGCWHCGTKCRDRSDGSSRHFPKRHPEYWRERDPGSGCLLYLRHRYWLRHLPEHNVTSAVSWNPSYLTTKYLVLTHVMS